ncbi:coiled-coil domain-containing protein 55-domain containing protein [Rhizophagus diaphanus]|nr:coiled-coil domain-containing protein 55-domain containing protein [Rhizophagus diaphanus] [Rhizophagus sp. MUCL 43196]
MQQNKQLKYGLNLSAKKTLQRSIFDEDEDNTTTKEVNSTRRVNRTLINKDTSLSKSVQEQHKAALEEDPTVFSYDEVYDDMKNAEKKTIQALQGINSASSNKPRYVNDLLRASEIRKRDYTLAQERKIQKEREAEGDEFENKEKFVTQAYKVQQEELKKAEEEEKRREKDANGSTDTTKFYRNLLDQASTAKTAAIEASRSALSSNKKRTFSEDGEYNKQKTDKELAEEARASGKIVMLNDDDQIVDKRQLLSAGLNISKKKNSSYSNSSSSKDYYDSRSYNSKRFGENDKSKYYEEKRRREKQSRELEEQILKTQREKEEEESKKQEELAKKFARKADEKTISDAKARYLARQKEKKELKKLKIEEEEL